MINLKDIYSLSDFQRRTREHIRRLKKTRRPEVLTVNGRAELIVQDAVSYQELLDALEQAWATAHPLTQLSASSQEDGSCDDGSCAVAPAPGTASHTR